MLDLPLEYALIGFEGDKFSGKIVPELAGSGGARHRALCGHRLHPKR